MARYDVYSGRLHGHLLLDVQTDLIDGLSTRMMVPLLPIASAPQRIRRLHPVFSIDGRDYVMATNLMAATQTANLGPMCANLTRHHDDIRAALDMLFLGF